MSNKQLINELIIEMGCEDGGDKLKVLKLSVASA